MINQRIGSGIVVVAARLRLVSRRGGSPSWFAENTATRGPQTIMNVSFGIAGTAITGTLVDGPKSRDFTPPLPLALMLEDQ